MLFIISDKHDIIKDKIINDLERGGTFLSGESLYKGTPKKVIHTVVDRRELAVLESFIYEVDKDAFITVVDSKEILGNGFKPLESKVD